MSVDDRERFSKWIAVGLPALVAVALLVGVVLRSALGVPWSNLIWPILALAVIQSALYVSMYRVRQRFRVTGDMRPGVAVFAFHLWVLGLCGIYFAERLRLIAQMNAMHEYLGFTLFMLVVAVGSVALFSFKKV